VALLRWAGEVFADDLLDRVLAATSLSFDLSRLRAVPAAQAAAARSSWRTTRWRLASLPPARA
jgi:hypothetical protein